MSELTNLEDARQALRRLIVVALEANRALFDGLQHPELDPPLERRAALNRILQDLGQIREGFTLAIRASDLTLASELQILIGQMIDWTWLSDVGLRWTTDEPLEKLGGQVVLYQHALIAFGVLPRLPEDAVTFPRGTYTDIPVPGTPGETLSRIEELEATIWGATNEPVQALPRGAFRRTYGFFDATTWLISRHLGDAIGL